jgi:hypothetical protein
MWENKISTVFRFVMLRDRDHMEEPGETGRIILR